MLNYNLVQATIDDFEFLLDVHHVTLRRYVEQIWGWDEGLQNKMFHDSFHPEKMKIIYVQNRKAGCVEINKKEEKLFISNILIMPEFQRNKIGTRIIKDIIHTSEQEGLQICLGVFKVNHDAKKLYNILGFRVIKETDTHFHMERYSEST